MAIQLNPTHLTIQVIKLRQKYIDKNLRHTTSLPAFKLIIG